MIWDSSDSKVDKQKELLKSYSLSTNRRKNKLRSHLETFMHDRDAWKASVIKCSLCKKMILTVHYSIYTPVKSQVRGGGNKTNKAQSSTMRHIVKLFGEHDVQKEF